MAINFKPTIKKPSFAPVLEGGTYHARIVRVIDLGLQKGYNEKVKDSYKVVFTFELLDEFMKEVDNEGKVMVEIINGVEVEKVLKDKPRWIDKEFSYNTTGVISEVYKIYPFLQAVDAFTNFEGIYPQYNNGFGYILGRPLDIIIDEREIKSGKNKGNKINTVVGCANMKQKDKVSAAQLVNPPIYFDLSNPDMTFFNSLIDSESPYALKNRILNNLEFKGSKLESLIKGVQEEKVEEEINKDKEEELVAQTSQPKPVEVERPF